MCCNCDSLRLNQFWGTAQSTFFSLCTAPQAHCPCASRLTRAALILNLTGCKISCGCKNMAQHSTDMPSRVLSTLPLCWLLCAAKHRPYARKTRQAVFTRYILASNTARHDAQRLLRLQKHTMQTISFLSLCGNPCVFQIRGGGGLFWRFSPRNVEKLLLSYFKVKCIFVKTPF